MYSYAFNNVSDATLKTEQAGKELGREFILKLTPRAYTWKEGKKTLVSSKTEINEAVTTEDQDVKQGFFAQEIEATEPTFAGVKKGESGIYTIEYGQLIAPMVSHLQYLDRLSQQHTKTADEVSSTLLHQKAQISLLELAVQSLLDKVSRINTALSKPQLEML
jgi:hypothetical protein